MFSGKKVTIGEKEYIVPGLTAGQLRNGALEKIKKHDELITAGQAFESYEIRTEIIGMALKRNYPKLTDAQLFDMVDTQNIMNLWQVILGFSGLTPGGEVDPSADPTISGRSIES